MLQVNLQPDYSIRLSPPDMSKLGQENLSKLEDESHIELNPEDLAKLGKRDLSKTDLIFSASGLRSPLGTGGLFTAIVIAIITVRVQKFFTDANLVIKLPESVPAMVYESFLSLSPLVSLCLCFGLSALCSEWISTSAVQTAFAPLVFALNTLPGILVYAFLVTMLWSVGINGDNAMDAIVAPIVFQYLGERRGSNARSAASIHHRERVLQHIRQCGRDRSNDRLGSRFVELKGARVPKGQPLIVAHASLSNQRTDLLWHTDCSESHFHDSVYS